MAFTYTEDLSNSRDFVRFWTGDTDSSVARLSDALITSLIAVEGSKEAAVVAALRYILTKLSEPNFKADWLQVDLSTARAGYEARLKEVRQAFGLSAVITGGTNVYRTDSFATEEPTYTDSADVEANEWWV